MSRLPYIWKMHWHYGKKEFDTVTMFGYYPISVYKDTTGQYTDEECDEDNIVEIPVPADLLWQWWLECLEFDRDPRWNDEPEGGWDEPTRDDLNRWVYKEYTCDDTYMLIDWLKEHNYIWKRI